MKSILERRLNCTDDFLKEEGLMELDKIILENKKHWQLAHLLGLIEHKEIITKLSNLIERIDRLEKKAGLSERKERK